MPYVVLVQLGDSGPPDVVGPFTWQTAAQECQVTLQAALELGAKTRVQWIYATVGELLADAAELEEE